MRVFEFHFNPPSAGAGQAPDFIFDSFCFEPENIYEKRMGSLYLAGGLKNVLPQNLHFLDKLAKVIQKEYFRSTVRKPEKALKQGLKEANEFLEQIAKKGDVSWLGNLSFAALSLTSHQKFGGGELNFTKIGDIKIFLLRGKRIVDIDRKLKFEEIAPWPLKIFGNIVSGKLAEDDVLLISTKEVTDFFEKENLLPEIAGMGTFDQKVLKEIFDGKKEEVLKISGLLLVIVLTKETLTGKKEVITPKSYPKEFNLKEVFSPFINFFKKITPHRFFAGGLKPSLKVPCLRFPDLKAKLKLCEGLPFTKIRLPKLNKNLILILVLIFLLFLGFFIAQQEEKQKLKLHQTTLNEIQEKVDRAEGLLILEAPQAEREANFLFEESWEEISQLAKIVSRLPEDFQNQVFSLKDEVSKKLFELNKVEIIDEPELFFDFNRREFVPQKMTIFNDELYFFSPYAENLFKLDKELKGEVIETGQKFNLVASLENSVAFFSKPDNLTVLSDTGLTSVKLQEPYDDFDFVSFFSFREHLYFLDSKPPTALQGSEIIRYPYLKNFEWDSPQLWLAREEKKAGPSKSLAVDGSIWLLHNDNSLSRYYSGRLQEKIVPEIFPEPKEFKKIFTSADLPSLYLLEPVQKRIVILDKNGRIVKQLQSQKFDNLLDFGVSADGKTIWLLNGLKVYQILL